MAATTTHPALEDFVEFLAKLAPRKVLEFKASPQAQERLFVLLQKTKKCRLILKKPKKWSITDDSAFG